MRRNERGWVLLWREGERYIQQRRWRERSKEGKDEIIVEMSEMCLRALQFLRVSLSSQFFCSKRNAATLASISLLVATVNLVALQPLNLALHFAEGTEVSRYCSIDPQCSHIRHSATGETTIYQCAPDFSTISRVCIQQPICRGEEAIMQHVRINQGHTNDGKTTLTS